MNGRTRAVAPGQDLAVEDAVPGQRRRRLDDLGELVADVVEVAGVEADVVAALVELGADAVVLVLDPDLRPEPLMISAASSAGEASMNLSGWNSAELGVVEPVVARELGQPPDVAGEHPGPLDVVERPVEGLRDGGLDEALAQPDAQLARRGP